LDLATLNFLQRKTVPLLPNPNMEDRVYVFMCPSDRVAQLYPRHKDFLFVAFYDSQGCVTGILTRLHKGNYFILSRLRGFVCDL
jgi:hypothetical protein